VTAIADDLIHAAGAVVWREGDAGPEVALIHRPKYDDWTFPKGKLDKGEHVLEAAVREVREETGMTPRLGRPLSSHTYVADGRPKRVDYWAATVRETGAGDGFIPGDEVDRLEWWPVPEAGRRLSYERDVALLREFAQGPLRTTTVIILRHASAGDRGDWRDLDLLRPLDRRGRGVARDLAGPLAAYAPDRLISSTTARCVETLLPYARHAETGVTTDPAFTVGEDGDAGPGGRARARTRIGELAAEAVSTVVCTHGELAPDLLAELSERFGRPVRRERAPRKGGFWVLHLATDEAGTVTGLAGVEGHAPGG
jgi:8-oxo-dGTP pyrophosphatase MutT (NUDIX family)/phosphohistidine phosphatase SixA